MNGQASWLSFTTGFSFAAAGRGKLLTAPFKSMLLGAADALDKASLAAQLLDLSLYVKRNTAHNQSSAFVVAPVSRINARDRFNVRFNRNVDCETAPVRGAKLGPSWGNGAGRPATFGYSQSHPARRRCSVLLIVLVFKSWVSDSTERLSDQAALARRAAAATGPHSTARQTDSPSEHSMRAFW
jgi:hypothetical protein